MSLAAAQFRQAFRLDPSIAERPLPPFAHTHIELGHAFMSLGRVEEAAVHYREALRIEPDSEEARDNLRRIEQSQTNQGG